MKLKYLKQRYQTYWFQKRPPKALESQLGTKLISINLQTSDIATAINKRDAILAQWAELSKGSSDAELYKAALAELNQQTAATDPEYGIDEPRINPDITDALSESRPSTEAEALAILNTFSPEDRAAFWALKKVEKNVEPPEAYSYSLREGLASYLKVSEGIISPKHYAKHTMVVDLFLGDTPDCSLHSIRKGEVYKWLESLGKGDSTRNTYLTCLSNVFARAQKLEHVADNLANPFKGLDHQTGESEEWEYIPDETTQSILNLLDPEDRLVAEVARATGMRISEVHNSTLTTVDGIECMTVKKTKTYRGGKSKTSRRDVPIPSWLLFDVLRLHPSWLGKHDSYGKRFGRAKSKVTDNPLICFHSLRVTFTTEAFRANFSEQEVSWITGHKTSRGTGMAAQKYHKGYSVAFLQNIIENVKRFEP
ncbi:MAG: hypothetical protein ACKVJ2_08615 [Pseudomonadales bacterium]